MITLLLVYRDCNQPKSKFVQTLLPIIENREDNFILLGDINRDILDLEESADYLNAMESSGFKSILNEPTRNLSCLDHVFCKSSRMQVTASILDIKITDHAIVKVEVKCRWNHK